MVKKVSCAGIIPLKKDQNNWMVLLVQHTQGHYWAFPKGHCEEGEELKRTAVRELKEETGLEVEKFVFDKPFQENYLFLREGEKLEKTVNYFAGIVKGDLELNQPQEIESAKWFTFQEALKMITYPESLQLFKRFLQQFAV